MAREEFDTCPKCGVGKMKPTGGAVGEASADPDTNRLTGDSYQEYKCDSCGYPEGGQAKAVQVNDERQGIGEPSISSSRSNNNNSSSSDIDSKDNQPF
jgi:predicted nucleic-acid-binding Zn-ribbon protein